MRVLFLIICTCQILFAQKGPSNPLLYYGDVMRNAQWSGHRAYAAKEFQHFFELEMAKPGSFKNNFDSLGQWISVLYPQDSLLRVISWQTDLDDGFQYFGYVQFASGKFIQLHDQSAQLSDLEFDILTPDRWYGALYYDIVTLDSKGVYLLLGYDAHSNFTTRKIAEVLVTSGDQVVQLGKEIFIFKDDPIRPTIKTRLIIEFAEFASVRLAFDKSSSTLFFDNLIPVETLENPGGTSMVQDGSYSGYQPGSDGHWYFVDKLFDHTADTPPRERPERENNKDLFGRDRTK